MLTSTALTSLRNYIRDTISYAKFKVGSTYYQANLRSAEVTSDGRVIISFLIDHTISGTITVTEVQLYDRNGALWASKAENITRKAVQEGILYRFVFTVTES